MATVAGDIRLHNLILGNNLFIMSPELTLPDLSIEVTVVTVDCSAVLPNLSIEVEAGVGVSVSGGLSLPQVSIEVEAGVGIFTTAEITLPAKLAIEVTAGAQHRVDGVLSLPNLSIICETAQACTVDASLTLPDLLLSGSARSVVAETFETWVINAMTFSHANYTNFNFNSYIELNGVVYGLNSSGIWALTGATDNGTAIVASAKWGVVDLGSNQKKIVDSGILHCRMADALTVGMSMDEGTRYAYTATDHGKQGVHAERVKFGKGLKGVFAQPDIANISGADFDFLRFDLIAAKGQRRSG